MSRGHCGRCKKGIEDENVIIYKYTCYNLNSDKWRQEAEDFDGSIYIEKDSFVELDVHEKIKRLPNGKKKIQIKRIHKDVDFQALLDSGKIKIQNSSHTWKTYSGYDFIALRLLRKIFLYYQDNAIIPTDESVNS